MLFKTQPKRWVFSFYDVQSDPLKCPFVQKSLLNAEIVILLLANFYVTGRMAVGLVIRQ